MEQTELPQPTTNWCCIVSTSVVAGGLCFFGVSLTLRGDGRTGLVLVLSSGALLMLSICAALGKCRHRRENKGTPSILEDPEDHPPSYRLSWRRSFKRRLRGDVEASGGGGGRGGGGEAAAAAEQGTDSRKGWTGKLFQSEAQAKAGGEEEELMRPTPSASFPNPDSSSSLDSLLAGQTEGVRGGELGGTWQEGRHTQSLSNLLDPPSYHIALAHLDEDSIRKLRSEMCLPSAIL